MNTKWGGNESSRLSFCFRQNLTENLKELSTPLFWLFTRDWAKQNQSKRKKALCFLLAKDNWLTKLSLSLFSVSIFFFSFPFLLSQIAKKLPTSKWLLSIPFTCQLWQTNKPPGLRSPFRKQTEGPLLPSLFTAQKCQPFSSLAPGYL